MGGEAKGSPGHSPGWFPVPGAAPSPALPAAGSRCCAQGEASEPWIGNGNTEIITDPLAASLMELHGPWLLLTSHRAPSLHKPPSTSPASLWSIPALTLQPWETPGCSLLLPWSPLDNRGVRAGSDPLHGDTPFQQPPRAGRVALGVCAPKGSGMSGRRGGIWAPALPPRCTCLHVAELSQHCRDTRILMERAGKRLSGLDTSWGSPHGGATMGREWGTGTPVCPGRWDEGVAATAGGAGWEQELTAPRQGWDGSASIPASFPALPRANSMAAMRS